MTKIRWVPFIAVTAILGGSWGLLFKQASKPYPEQVQENLLPNQAQFPFIKNKKDVEVFIQGAAALEKMQERSLAADGWTMTEVSKPDPAVLQLTDEAFKYQEVEALTQLSTVGASAKNYERLKQLALQSNDERVRFTAIDAIGRSNHPTRSGVLIEVFQNTQNDEMKSQILGQLHPSSFSDPVTQFLMDELKNQGLKESIKKQIVFNLASVTIPSKNVFVTQVDIQDKIQALPRPWRDEVAKISKQLQSEETSLVGGSHAE